MLDAAFGGSSCVPETPSSPAPARAQHVPGLPQHGATAICTTLQPIAAENNSVAAAEHKREVDRFFEEFGHIEITGEMRTELLAAVCGLSWDLLP